VKLLSHSNATGPTPLDYLVHEFRQAYYLPDPYVLYLSIGTYIANMIEGPPVWTMIIGPPSTGGTIALDSIDRLHGMHSIDKFSAAALLSGTPKRDRADDATGGILMEIGIGGKGLILFKDFNTVIHMSDSERESVLSDLGRIYDGEYSRSLGADGGRKLYWHGKVGALAKCTQELDTFMNRMSAFGQRFLYFRPTKTDGHAEAWFALNAVTIDPRLTVETFFRNIGLDVHVQEATMSARGEQLHDYRVDPAGERFLHSLTMLLTRGRTAIKWDFKQTEMEDIHDSEGPGRFIRQIKKLYIAFDYMQIPDHDKKNLLRRVALSSIPRLRSNIIQTMYTRPGENLSIRDIGLALIAGNHQCPGESTIRRALQELTALGMISAYDRKTSLITNFRDADSSNQYGLSNWVTDLMKEVY